MPDETHRTVPADADPFETPSKTARTSAPDEMANMPFIRQPDEADHTPEPEDVRGHDTTTGDQSEHRRYQWFYEDLIS